MDYEIVIELGPGTVFIDGQIIGTAKRCVATVDKWPEVVIEDLLDADEIG